MKAQSLAAVSVDDAMLVEQARRGDDRAFAGNDSEVDDVLQEAFTDAACALDDLRDPSGFRELRAQEERRRRLHGAQRRGAARRR